MKNTVITTIKRWIVFLGLTTQGPVHDYELLKEGLHWYDGQRDWSRLPEIFVDPGYVGIGKGFGAKKLNIPFKKPKKSKNNPEPKLTEEQKEHNKEVGRIRVLVEHAIGSMKFFKVLTQPYRNHKDGFEDLSVGICAGLHNLAIKIKTN